MTSRRMRRTRDVSNPRFDLMSGYDLYQIQGDSKAALESLQQHKAEQAAAAASAGSGKGKGNAAATTSVADYNILLLQQLASNNSDKSSILKVLEDCESKLGRRGGDDSKATKQSPSKPSRQLLPSFARKRARNELIMVYNRALVMHGAGETAQCAALMEEHLVPLMKQQLGEEMIPVAFHMGLLLLEALLGLHVGRNSTASSADGSRSDSSEKQPSTTTNKITMTELVEWLELLDHAPEQGDPQLKFLLSLYKSRVDLSQRDVAGKHVDGRIRSARKELKSAMEVFQQKLRPSFGAETGSVVSSANSAEESTAAATTSEQNQRQHSHQQQQPPSSIVLQKYNQSALSLKANLEQLKGNTKKSLILCSEAQSAVVKPNNEETAASSGDAAAADGSSPASSSSSLYDVVHSNNLAVVYETNDKRHLALHALTKGLRAAAAVSDGNDSSTLFHPDGMVRPNNLTTAVLHNAAICALQAKNYLSAYECLAACVCGSISDQSSNAVFRNRPRCWLRMAQACIGRFTELRRQKSTKFATVEINGEPHGIVMDSSMLTDDVTVIREKLVEQVGSPEDLEQVKRTPLLRARACLERVIHHHADDATLDAETLTGARMSLAYVSLAFGDYQQALHISKLILDEQEGNEDSSQQASSNDSQQGGGGAADSTGTPPSNPVARRLRARQIATARMYAAEASCALGEMVESMKYLVGDGKDDAFDRLASDLGGVTLETAAGNGKGKRRLAKAQTMVRSSACAVTAAMGNTQAAKQLANSANAMEDAYASNRERSSARRALIYALLRDGHQSPALNLLMSLR